MDSRRYRLVALAVWGPLVAGLAVSVLQIVTGDQPVLFRTLTRQVGGEAVSFVLWLLFVVGGVALVNSDIGERPSAK